MYQILNKKVIHLKKTANTKGWISFNSLEKKKAKQK